MTPRPHGAILLLLAANAGACCPGGSATTPASAPPAPVDLAAGAADTPVDTSAESPELDATSASRPAHELATRLLGDHDIALHDAARDAVVYPARWSEEGSGEGLRIEQLVGDGAPTTLVERLVGEPADPARRDELAAKLDGASWVVLERVPWPDADAPLSVPDLGLTATFAGPSLTLEAGGKKASTSIGPPSSTPHLPSPVGLYVAAGSDVVVVHVDFDPGSAYGQGYNHYDEHRVLRLK